MTEHDRPGGEYYPRRERPRALPAYHQVARFSSEEAAGIAFQQVRQQIFAREDADLSVFRFQFRPAETPVAPLVSHVAVVGQTPPDDLAAQLQQLLAAGEAVELPEDVLRAFAQRRREAARRGHWVEGHYRPGRRL